MKNKINKELNIPKDNKIIRSEVFASDFTTPNKNDFDLIAKRHIDAIENMIEGYQILGFDWKYLYINKSAEQHNRMPKEEMLGRRYQDVWNGIEDTEVFNLMKRSMDLRVSNLVQNEFIFPDGSIGWFELSIQPVPEGIFILSVDITNRKIAEKALIDSEERFRKAFMTSPDSININRLEDGRYVNINQGFTNIMGYTEAEIIGKTSIEKNIWVDPSERKKLVDGLKKDGSVSNLEAQFRRKDGSISTGLMSASIIELEGIPHILSITRDIGDYYRIQEALLENEERFRRVFQEGQFSMALCGKDFRFLKVNDAFCRMIGYFENELLALTFIDITHPDHLEGDIESIKKLHDGLIEVYQSEKRYIRKDNKVVWGSINISAMRNQQGNFLYFLAMINDITERKKVEEALLQSEERLSLYMEYSPIYTYIKEVTPTESRVLNASNNFVEMLGFKAKEMIGKTMDELYPPEFAAKITADDWNVISSGKIIQLEEEFNERFYTTIKYPILQSHKNLLAGYTIDITEIKNYEDKLIQAKERAEESDRLKTAFLANMSHEIRTPMNGILGFAGLLKEPNLAGEDQQSYINLIEKSGARMLNIINDLITISKVESGLMDLTYSNTNVNDQMDFLFNFFKSEANLKGISLKVRNTLTHSHATFETDREKLFSILTNLIKNALKFTNAGSVEFGYDLKGDFLEFYVTDSGIGIPPDKHDAVFDRFVQADTSLSRGYEGAGLGLSISKAYVEMLGGKIWIDSQEGVGSTFNFTIPARKNDTNESTTRQTLKEVTEIKNHKMTILIVEDDEDSRRYLSIILKNLKCAFFVAQNGKEAVEFCRNYSDINLVLMDIKMPVMDGHTAAIAIKDFRPNLPIIAQTAYALDVERKKYGDIFNAYITKPIKTTDLKQKINQFLDI